MWAGAVSCFSLLVDYCYIIIHSRYTTDFYIPALFVPQGERGRAVSVILEHCVFVPKTRPDSV